MNKKIIAGALAGVMAVASATVVSAETYTKDNPIPAAGVVIDASAGWVTGAADQWIAITDEKVTVTFENEPFIGEEQNWFNFVIETNNAGGKTAGATLRADAFGWTYENENGNLEAFDDGGSVPSNKEISWDWETETDKFREGSKGTLKVTATKTDSKTLVFDITFSNGLTEKYTLTYADGVPEGLAFTIGGEKCKVTLKSAVYGEESSSTTTEDEEPETTEDNNNSNGNGNVDGDDGDDKGTPNSGIEGVAVVAGLAIVAAGAVVVAKKRK